VEAVVPLGGAALVAARVRLDDGVEDRYVLPLATASAPIDVLAEPTFARSLLDVMTTGARVSGTAGAISGRPTSAAMRAVPKGVSVRGLGGEQSNTSIVVGDLLVLKQFRRLGPGINPEEEVTRFLTERTPFRHAPRLLGSLAYEPSAGEAGTLAVAHEFVADAEDGWRWMLAELRTLATRFGATARGVDDLRRGAAVSLDALRRLGERTGQLHVALASDPRDPDFAPEPITEDDVRSWADGIHRQIEAARAALGGRLPCELPGVARALAGLAGAMKIRQHGDFHLGQTLYRVAHADFAIVDFEGEPLRPLAERRLKHAAMRDVAGLRRSISYAAAAEYDGSRAPWREIWEAEGQRAFVDGYLTATRGRHFIPAAPAVFAGAVAAFELEKAAYEIVYEISHRPAWVTIPVRGLVSAAARIRVAASSASA
jgi:maltokinase